MFAYLERVLRWLKQGYPTGIPDADYVPLLAVLRRRLSDDEIVELREGLLADGMLPHDRVDVGERMMRITDEVPSNEEIQRVITRLQAAGWPIDEGENQP